MVVLRSGASGCGDQGRYQGLPSDNAQNKQMPWFHTGMGYENARANEGDYVPSVEEKEHAGWLKEFEHLHSIFDPNIWFAFKMQKLAQKAEALEQTATENALKAAEEEVATANKSLPLTLTLTPTLTLTTVGARRYQRTHLAARRRPSK